MCEYLRSNQAYKQPLSIIVLRIFISYDGSPQHIYELRGVIQNTREREVETAIAQSRNTFSIRGTPTSRPAFRFDFQDTRIRIPNVTMFKNYKNDEEFEGGVLQLNGKPRWLFFESRYWTYGGILMKDSRSCAYILLNGIYTSARIGKKVFVMYKSRRDEKTGEWVEFSPEYTLIFASEKDARTFTESGRDK